jgi:hypothetical protein
MMMCYEHKYSKDDGLEYLDYVSMIDDVV